MSFGNCYPLQKDRRWISKAQTREKCWVRETKTIYGVEKKVKFQNHHLGFMWVSFAFPCALKTLLPTLTCCTWLTQIIQCAKVWFDIDRSWIFLLVKDALRGFFLSFNCRNCLHYRDCLTVYRSLLCFNLSVIASVPSMGISNLIHSHIQPIAPVFLSFNKVRNFLHAKLDFWQ